MTLRPLSRTLKLGLMLAIASPGALLLAQGDTPQGEAGVSGGLAGIDSGSSFEVSGVEVDVAGKTADAARQGGWRLAQRKGWAMLAQRLGGEPTTLSDSALDAIVTGVVVENEEIGPNRYIARLGVLFDRGRSGAILGVATQIQRSPPMLVVPLMWSGGAARVFERESPWQKAWARFRSGESRIDYVRPTGTGPDSLLLNSGQADRRGRNWWRIILDQYGASDVLVAEVQLRREWPGGPIIGTFTASHGPDGIRITQFALRVNSGDALDALLDAGVKRIDQAYQDALAAGRLNTDRLLGVRPPSATPVAAPVAVEATPTPVPSTESGTVISVQVDTPSAASVTASEATLRGIPGVRSAATSSLALGGVSVVRVTFDGTIGSLRAALEGRGWQVQEGPGVLRIRRGAPPAASPPSNATQGE